MADMEDTVVELAEVSAADDAQQAQGEPISAVAEEPQNDAQEQNEPKDAGWFKQRIAHAVNKAVAETQAKLEQYERQIQELQSERLERQAQELVRTGEFKSLDTAKEYLQLKGGAHVENQPQAPTQQEENQPEIDPVVQAKADMLAKQAAKIKSTRGLDVMAAYNQDPEIQRRLASGEWDFYDVADSLESKPKAPAPIRNANGARNEPVSIRNMTEKQWKELNRRIELGSRFRAD